MSKQAQELSNSLIGHLANIEKTRKKAEELFASGQLVKRDVDIIYGGLYIEAVTSFERFIESLFLSLLSGSVEHLSKRVKARVTFDSVELARSILVGERRYLDWFPYDNTIKRAKAYFKDGLPFYGLDKGRDVTIHPSLDGKIKQTVEKLLIIRNVLAHKSRHAYHRFEDNDPRNCPSCSGKKPIGFLRGHHTTTPTIHHTYQQIISDIKYISQLITSRGLH